MPIYIAPFNPQNHYLNISSYDQVELLEIYYKTMEGPLGFNTDEKSRIIFKKVVEDSIWFSESKNDFETMTEDFLLNNRMYHFNGVFMMPNEYIEQEIAAERKRRLIIEKNKLLKRYNKPLQKETPTFFADFYKEVNRKYSSSKIEELLAKKIDIAIGHTDSLGSHFIMQENSIFMNKLLSSCNELDVFINRVDSDKYVPAW